MRTPNPQLIASLMAIKAEADKAIAEAAPPDWTTPTLVRTNKCCNGHVWNAQVRHGNRTTCLSGEKTEYCPECGNPTFTASSWRILIGDQLFTYRMGEQINTTDADLYK
jgi:hypothetical protein